MAEYKGDPAGAAEKLAGPDAVVLCGEVYEDFKDVGWDNAPNCAFCDEPFEGMNVALCDVGAGWCGYHHECVGAAAYDIRFGHNA